jgi:hypothetical protein
MHDRDNSIRGSLLQQFAQECGTVAWSAPSCIVA